MARYLSTTSDRISQGASPIPQSAGSLGFWVLPNWAQNDGVDHYFFAAQNSPVTEDFSLQKFSDNHLYFGWNKPGGADSRINVASYSLAANAWNHFLLTWDSGGSILYLNGASIGTKTAPVTFDTTGNVRYWGYSAIASGLQSNQLLAECAIWTAKLTADEALALARGCLPRAVRPGTLDSYLPLWGLASPEPDLSGNAKNATLTGTTQANHAPVTLFTRKARAEVEPAGGSSSTFNAPSLTATWNLPQPTIASLATFSASSVSASWNTPQPACASDSTFNATALSSTWNAPQPTIVGEATLDLLGITATWDLPQPTIASGGSNTFNAPTLESIWSLPQPEIASECTLAVAAASATWNIPTPTIAGTSLLDANAMTTTWNLPQPTITQSNPFVNGNELVFTARDPGRHFVACDPGRHFQGREP